jgi:hypothetical protein
MTTLPSRLPSKAARSPDRQDQPGRLRCSEVVVRGGVEPPTFRFSGLRTTVQDWPRRSICLLSGPRYTPIDAGAHRCMRLEMRLCLGRDSPFRAPRRCPVSIEADRALNRPVRRLVHGINVHFANGQSRPTTPEPVGRLIELVQRQHHTE